MDVIAYAPDEYTLLVKAEAARCNRQLSAEALHRCLLDRVTDFCGGEFEDDATVLVIAVS